MMIKKYKMTSIEQSHLYEFYELNRIDFYFYNKNKSQFNNKSNLRIDWELIILNVFKYIKPLFLKINSLTDTYNDSHINYNEDENIRFNQSMDKLSNDVIILHKIYEYLYYNRDNISNIAMFNKINKLVLKIYHLNIENITVDSLMKNGYE